MDLELKALEKFVLSKDRGQALKEFQEGSKVKSFLVLLNEMRNGDFDGKIDAAQLEHSEKRKLAIAQMLEKFEKDPEGMYPLLRKEMGVQFDWAPPKSLNSTVVSHFPSVLNQDLLTVNLESKHKDLELFRKSTWKAKKKLNIQDLSAETFKELMKTPLEALKITGTLDRIALEYVDNTAFDQIFTFMMLDQLEYFEKKRPDIVKNPIFVVEKLKQKYDFAVEDMKELYCALNGFYMDARDYKFEGLISIALLNLLVIGPKLGVYDETVLQEYLYYHRRSNLYLTPCVLSEAYAPFLKFLLKAPEETQLLDMYFNAIFSKAPDFQWYISHINSEYLEKASAKAILLSGGDISKVPNVFTMAELNSLSKLTILQSVEESPKTFAKSDLVKFDLKLKNISTLVVKVIELNTKSFYLQKKQEITPDINLDGLVVADECMHTIQENTLKLLTKSFEFPSLTGKSGSFIIEFTGNGLQSRVLIKKGSLRYISKITAGGHLISIFDEDNQICENGGVYIDDKFYPIGAKNFTILPYAPIESQKNLILTDNETFQLIRDFTQLKEDFQLKCAFLLHNEQFVYGKPAKILINPKLFINGIQSPEFMTSNLKATILTTDVEGLTASKVFEDLKFSNEMIPLEIVVPGRLVKIEVVVNVDLDLRGEKKVLRIGHVFGVNTILTDPFLYKTYVRYTNEGYFIDVLGRNGEIWKNIEVQCRFSLSCYTETVYCVLATDENGQIRLGRLKGVTSFVLDCNGTVEYNIKACKPISSYPTVITLCEGDKFQLPFYQKDSERPHKAMLLQLKSGKYHRDSSQYLSYTSGFFSFPNIEKGEYELNLPSGELIKLIVVEGVHWTNDFILADNQVFSTKGQYNSLSINPITKSENQLKITLSGDTSSAKLYILSSNFLTPNMQLSIQNLAQSMETIKSSISTFAKPSVVYVNNKTLDEEYRYILDRKQMPKFIGNTLPKPQLLMKREEIGETNTIVQNAYRMKDLLRSQDDDYCAKECSRGGVYDLFPNRRFNSNQGEYFDFLQDPAYWKEVQVVDGTADVEFQGLGHVFIVACNGSSTASRVYCETTQVKYRDITAKFEISKDKTYIEKNSCEVLRTGDNFVLNDSGNSFEIIDSLDKLFALQKELSANREFDEWRFLTRWSLLSNKEKEEKYEKYLSHELNLFIFHKDPEYFKSTVRPFLSCKLEKTLIDKYLLSESMEDFENSWEELNALEKVVYISWLKNLNYPRAVLLVQHLKDFVISHPVPIARKESLYKSVFKISSISTSKPNIFASPPPPPPGCPPPASYPLPAGFGSGPPLPPPQMNAPQFFSAPTMDEGYFLKGSQPLGKKCSAPPDFGEKFFGISESLNMISQNNCSFDLEGFGDFEPDNTELQLALEKNSFYKKLDATKEYIESNYYKQTSRNENLIRVSGFWAELAESILNNSDQILTESVLTSTSSLSELISVLSFSALPFISIPHQYLSQGKSLQITANNNLLVFYKDISEAHAQISGQVLATHQYFNPHEKDHYGPSGEIIEKNMESLVKQCIYVCKLVITNVSSLFKNLKVLQNVPEGSIPITPPITSRNLVINLKPYTSEIIQYAFYFPKSGNFDFFLANIAEGANVIAVAEGKNLQIYDTEKIDTFVTFSDIVIGRNDEGICEYLLKENCYSQDYDLKLIYFKLKNQEFYQKVIEILKSREIFDKVVYGFSFLHCDLETAKIFIKKNEKLKELLKYIPNKFFPLCEYPHYEYNPLVNARVYQLGQQSRITNQRIAEVYKELLVVLAQKPNLTVKDKVRICQYLIYQDEREKAVKLFEEILTEGFTLSVDQPGHGELQIQIDYLGAYLIPEVASKIAPIYLNYPVKHWRKLFADISEVLLETNAIDLPQSIVLQNEEPSLSVTIEGPILKLSYINVQTCTIKLYVTDLEVIFSRNPFTSQDSNIFSYAKPSLEIPVKLLENGLESIKLPDEYLSKNMIIEVDYIISSKHLTYYATDIKVNLLERIGVIKVVSKTGKPRPGVYIKVYAKYTNNNETFYKDGFTDIRGKFDYVSLSTDSLSQIVKFSILVADEDFGSLVIQANPPPQ